MSFFFFLVFQTFLFGAELSICQPMTDERRGHETSLKTAIFFANPIRHVSGSEITHLIYKIGHI